ncbi:MAG: nitrous oxide reductase accessory protein NosL [Spirosomataceae bacterium]
MKKLPLVSRILLAVASLSVIACYYLPLWKIALWAPQYPEGLAMTIWYNNVGGDVDVINGLNHYIGMKHIKVEMFPEFRFLQYIIAGFILWGLFVSLMGTVRWLKIYIGTLVLGAIIALADFYRWGYEYGHDLDPTAPIQVPGMAYQPPVLGYKDLLNFTALSIPDTGGWIIVAVGVLAFVLLLRELISHRAMKPQQSLNIATALLIMGVFLACTSSEPEAINYGKDGCHGCKMTLVDQKFGVELITKKGKIFKFDDLNCYVNFTNQADFEKQSIGQVYVVDYAHPAKLIKADQAFFLKSNKIRSPMGSGLAAFKQQQDCLKTQKERGGVCQTWQNVSSGNLEAHEHEHHH